MTLTVWGVRFTICKYLTYKEWKPLLGRFYMMPSCLSVSTLPIRNGNYTDQDLPYSDRKACKYFTYKEWKPFSWPVFVHDLMDPKIIYCKYLTCKEWKHTTILNWDATMLDFSKYLTYKEWKHPTWLQVIGRTQTPMVVSTLPIRNGNWLARQTICYN